MMSTRGSKTNARVLEFCEFGVMEDSGQVVTFLDLHFTHPVLGDKINPIVLQTIGCLGAEYLFEKQPKRKKQPTGFEVTDKNGTCRLMIDGKHRLTKSITKNLLNNVCQYIIDYPEDRLDNSSDTRIIQYDIAGAKILTAYYFVSLVEAVGLS